VFLPDHPARSADNRAVWRHVARNDGIRSDNRVVTNSNAFQNDGVDAQPTIMLDYHGHGAKFSTQGCSFAFLANDMI
jgi:hypothetical protein